MIMASSKLLLSILRTEYETPAVGEWVTSRQADVEDARRHVIRPREELDRRSLHIGMMDLVIEGCSEDRSAPGRCPGRTAIATRIGTA
jgi:hypothetical protein